MKYSEKAMWGKGIYFAANAKYSDPYAFSEKIDMKPAGSSVFGKTISYTQRRMFLAYVNLGDVEYVAETNPDRKNLK